MNNITEYTLETLPEVINYNQFYCYHKASGKIAIGTIIGKSATSGYMLYEVNGITYEEYQKNADKKSFTIDRKFLCFNNYEDFVSFYKKHMIEKQKSKKASYGKKRYIVDKNIFYTTETKAKITPYNCVEFFSKEEAVDYANKGLVKLRKEVAKHIEKLKKILIEYLEKEVALRKTLCELTDAEYMESFIAKPSNLKENDIITKLKRKDYFSFTTLEVDEENTTIRVKGFIKPDIVQLSDNTILIERECCSISWPTFIKYACINKATIILKRRTLKREIQRIKYEIDNLEEVKKFADNYKPLAKSTWIYFRNNETKKDIKDWEEYIKTV